MLGTVVVFGLFLVGVVISVIRLNAGTLTAGSAVLWFVVLLAVLGRQIVLTVDNDRLRQILERRVIERNRSLRQVTQQSDLLVNSVGDGIYGVDRDGLVTFVNPAAARALGYRPHELIGRDAHATFHEPQDDGSPFPADQCYVTEAIRDQVATNSEEDTYRRADGRAIPVEADRDPTDRGRPGDRRGRGLPRRHPAPGGRPVEERVRVHGQPRAPYPADRDPRLARTDRRWRDR